MAHSKRRSSDNPDKKPKLETDERFPSGPWEGFFLMSHTGTKRHMMELILTFSETKITGEGRDLVGEFVVNGRYELENGRCHWNKKYVAKHDVAYEGYNEGKGIFGKWEIQDVMVWHGGFLIWPQGMGDPTKHRKRAEEDVPVEGKRVGVSEEDFVTVSADSALEFSETLDDDIPF